VSGARAADAVVYEPEPVEYVKVCDAYGAGFFYIPGTETCLSISGYVWVQLGFTNDGPGKTPNYHQLAANSYNPYARARVNFDARSDTEWGTLRSYIRVQSDWFGGISADANAVVDQAFIELGGFRAGYTESAWNDAKDAGVANWGSHSDWGMSYGYQQRFLMSYTFAANGFSATLSLEDDDNVNYVPDVVAVVAYNAGWGGVWAKLAYDEDRFDKYGAIAFASSFDGFAASIGAQFNIPNMAGSNLRVIGYYSDSDNRYGPTLAGVDPFGPSSEWSVMAAYNHAFSSTLSASIAAQYFNNFYFPLASVGTGIDGYQIEAEMVWTPVTNFEVRAAVAYSDVNTPGISGSTSGFLRFTRYF
ncbi:MAG: porin, partial [Notoacmeibacter sp.]|nr:porin [Notoacmeibacter sp.]